MNTESAGHSSGMKVLSPDIVDAIFDRLRALNSACGPTANLHDRAIVLICASIDEGFNTGPRIIGALKRLGFKAGHVGKVLRNGTGNHPVRHFWHRDEAGIYGNYAQAFATDPSKAGS